MNVHEAVQNLIAKLTGAKQTPPVVPDVELQEACELVLRRNEELMGIVQVQKDAIYLLQGDTSADDLRDANNCVTALRREVRELKAKLEEKDRQITNQAGALKIARNKIDSLHQQAKSFEDAVRGRDGRIEVQNNRINAQVQTINSQSAEVGQLRTTLEDLRGVLSRQGDTLAERDETVRSLREEVKACHAAKAPNDPAKENNVQNEPVAGTQGQRVYFEKDVQALCVGWSRWKELRDFMKVRRETHPNYVYHATGERAEELERAFLESYPSFANDAVKPVELPCDLDTLIRSYEAWKQLCDWYVVDRYGKKWCWK